MIVVSQGRVKRLTLGTEVWTARATVVRCRAVTSVAGFPLFFSLRTGLDECSWQGSLISRSLYSTV